MIWAWLPGFLKGKKISKSHYLNKKNRNFEVQEESEVSIME